MHILDNVIIVSIIVSAFIAGMKISDRYHFKAQQHEEYALRLQNARIQSGDYAAYVAPPGPLGQEFETRLKENGRATQQIGKRQTRQ